MDSLSKYDIADVISHISRKGDTPGAENKGGALFEELLSKAVKGSPDLKSEAKVAESGEGSPDFASALKKIHQESDDSVDSVAIEYQSNLDIALTGSFFRGQVLSDSLELASEDPNGLNHLKNVLSIELESKNKIGHNQSVISGEKEIAGSDNLLRVTTLKHNRPVILGPEYVSSQPNYHQGDAQAIKLNSGKEGLGNGEINDSAVTFPKPTEIAKYQGPPSRFEILRTGELVSDEKNEFRGLSGKSSAGNEIDAQAIKLNSGKQNLGIDGTNNSAVASSKSTESLGNQGPHSRFLTAESNNGGSESKSAVGVGGEYEFRGLSAKNGAENEIKNSAENLVKNEKTITKLDLQKPIQPSANLSEKNIDSPINVIMNESAESADHELTSIIQQEKSPVLNRAEILPKPVSVSNFNSEIRETIFGQLTKAVNGVTKFKVALYPENFGKISIEISYSENAGLKINMIGDNPEATRILEQNLPSLRDNLQTEKLSELVVNLNSNRDSQGFGNKNSKSENENSGDSVKNDRAPAELVESDAMRRQENLGVSSGDGLDTYV